MVNLLQNWCPLVLYCGFLVRQCNWAGQHPGSAIDAHHVLRLVFVLLTELSRGAADPLVYARTIGVALLHWQAFNGALPGLCYGEEFGEVMLSRLRSKKDRHTWAVTPSDVEDLFVQISPTTMNRRLLVSGLSSDIETEIRQRLYSYVTDERLRIRYCAWESGVMLVCCVRRVWLSRGVGGGPFFGLVVPGLCHAHRSYPMVWAGPGSWGWPFLAFPPFVVFASRGFEWELGTGSCSLGWLFPVVQCPRSRCFGSTLLGALGCFVLCARLVGAPALVTRVVPRPFPRCVGVCCVRVCVCVCVCVCVRVSALDLSGGRS